MKIISLLIIILVLTGCEPRYMTTKCKVYPFLNTTEIPRIQLRYVEPEIKKYIKTLHEQIDYHNNQIEKYYFENNRTNQ